MLIEAGELLRAIQTPEDLRRFSPLQLRQVCDELRQFIIDQVSVYGGHFGASLGVIELSVALHYVLNTPDDMLVWDVGHQAYGHKILTGRRDIFHTNRVYGGISGFPKRKESIFDTFGVGHSSTSISAALGMAIASKLKGEDRQHVAVIGDGSMTAGLAFEAMNHAGFADANILIILNDNCMSIDPNVGALKDYLTDISTSSLYNRFRNEVWRILGKFNKIGGFQKLAAKVEQMVKGAILKQSNLFEALGIRYFGPIDGHDIQHLVSVLEDLKHIPGPKILHCITTKGKGYELAEKDQTKWHAPGTFDKITGEIHKKIYTTPQPPKYQDVFGHTLLELAQQNPKIMGITPAMPSGSSLNIMMKAMPHRALDVGIAEQHAVTVSAGLATQGQTVFCNIYSSFMQRAYDQVVHDVCIQELPVIFCLDRGGFAGADGPTHHGAYDIAYMRCVPNMMVFSPMNEQELRNLMYTVSLDEFKNLKTSISIRYPRGEGVMPNWRLPFEKMELGKGRLVQKGEKNSQKNNVAILTIGHIGNYAVTACEELAKQGIKPAHYDMRFVKPLDEEMLHEICQNFDKIITIEDGCIMGGFGSAVLEWIADHDYNTKVKRLGMADKIYEHGTQMELHTEAGFSPTQIAQEVKKMINVAVLR
jgi:1-deoxy-D-xylulose-5-phosphate synthase